jgi:hypothetical protein
MRAGGAFAAVVLASATAHADQEPEKLIGVGLSVGPETPGFSGFAELGAGVRTRDGGAMWHGRLVWGLFSGRWGGGHGEHVEVDFYEGRFGPTWWSCGPRACTGASAEAGFQYRHAHESGTTEDGDPYASAERTAYLVGDFRIRVLVPSWATGAIELNVALRTRMRTYASRYHNGHEDEPQDDGFGGGFHLGIGAHMVF